MHQVVPSSTCSRFLLFRHKMSFLNSSSHRLFTAFSSLPRQITSSASTRSLLHKPTSHSSITSVALKPFHSTSSKMASNPVLNSENISKITDAEKKITGSDNPVRDGPTAQAQKHANETINRDTLHNITEGEKKITGDQRPVAGGPTAVAQSELAKSRS